MDVSGTCLQRVRLTPPVAGIYQEEPHSQITRLSKDTFPFLPDFFFRIFRSTIVLYTRTSILFFSPLSSSLVICPLCFSSASCPPVVAQLALRIRAESTVLSVCLSVYLSISTFFGRRY